MTPTSNHVVKFHGDCQGRNFEDYVIKKRNKRQQQT